MYWKVYMHIIFLSYFTKQYLHVTDGRLFLNNAAGGVLPSELAHIPVGFVIAAAVAGVAVKTMPSHRCVFEVWERRVGYNGDGPRGRIVRVHSILDEALATLPFADFLAAHFLHAEAVGILPVE